MNQPGSTGSYPTGVQSVNTYQRAASAPAAIGDLRGIESVNACEEPRAHSAPPAIAASMREPTESSWLTSIQSFGETLYSVVSSVANFPLNCLRASHSAATLGVRATNYLATSTGQLVASTAMTLLENSSPIVEAVIGLSSQEEGQQLFNDIQNVAARLPRMTEQVCDTLADNPELGQNIYSTMQKFFQTTQNVAANLPTTSQDFQNFLRIMNTVLDGINDSHLTQATPTQATPTPPSTITEQMTHTTTPTNLQNVLGIIDTIINDTNDPHLTQAIPTSPSTIIQRMTDITSGQVTHLINGTVAQLPTDLDRLVRIITEQDGNLEQVSRRLAAHITNTAINNFTTEELNTLAQSVVDRFQTVIGDLPQDTKLRLIHAVLKNDPFGHIVTPCIRRIIGWPPADPAAPPLTLTQKIGQFFTNTTHALSAQATRAWNTCIRLSLYTIAQISIFIIRTVDRR